MQFFNLSTGVLLLSAVLSTTALPTFTPNAIALQARDEVSEAKTIWLREKAAAQPKVHRRTFGIWEGMKSGWKAGLAREEAKYVKKVLLKADKDYQARLASGAVKNPAEKATKPTIHRRMWGALKNVWRVDRVRGFAMRWERYEAKKEQEARVKNAAAQAAKITRHTPMSGAVVKGLEEGLAAARKKEANREALKAEQRAQAQLDRQEAEAENAALKEWAAKAALRDAHEAKMIQRHGSREKWQKWEADRKDFREDRKKAGLDASDIKITARPATIQRRTPMWGGAVKGWKESIAAAKKKKADQQALKAEQIYDARTAL
ncbi:hypothetical protein HYALB_00001301 [Hymenoscyphus albidus]|uniref:Uncharacterized protein n=1 Tax=Hymenoscyphus albidus TaxID=595503 RepID=A0A9N9LHU8_9HELO|nr:hypothetical protein HYALB_00001301 [Hymenoscyphus albidus]